MDGPTKSGMLAVDANSYRPLLDGVKTLATSYEHRVSVFKGYVDRPGGTAWEGATAEAGQANAADGWKVAARIQDRAETFEQTAGLLVDHTIVPSLTNGQHMIHEWEQHPDIRVNEDLSMTYTPPQGISKEDADHNTALVATAAKELKASGDTWWNGVQQLKTLTYGVAKDIGNEVNGAAATFDIGKAVADTAPGKPDAHDGNFYKDWYPKKTDPASVDPGAGTLADTVQHVKNPATTPAAAAASVDPNAPQYGPFAKDTIDKTKLGGIDATLGYVNRDNKPPEEHKPSAAERFKTDISDGIDKGVDKLVAPFKDLRDRLGLGDKGFWEANEEQGKREWESFKHRLTTPPIVDMYEGVKHNVENPGQYVGEKLVDGAAILAGGPVGPEGALTRVGLEESAAARLGSHPDLPGPGAVTHEPPPAAHAPVEPPTGPAHPAPVIEHPESSVGDHSIPPAGNHAPYVALPHDAPTPSPLPSDHPLFEGYHPTEPGPKYTNPDGGLHYPDASDPAKPYAVPGTVVDDAKLTKGTVLGRFGYPGGEWLAPEGTPFAKLALPNESALKPYYEYVVSDPAKLPPGWRIEQSQVAPWFHQPGEGTQYRIIAPPGQKPNAQFLEDSGFLARISRENG